MIRYPYSPYWANMTILYLLHPTPFIDNLLEASRRLWSMAVTPIDCPCCLEYSDGSTSLHGLHSSCDVVTKILPDRNINLFANDIALYRIIKSPEDYTWLQDDITAVSSCPGSKHLDLNASKCCYLLLSQKRVHFTQPPTLMLNDVPLKCVISGNPYLYTSDLM